MITSKTNPKIKNISKLEKFFIFNVLIPNNLTKVSEFFGEKLQL